MSGRVGSDISESGIDENVWVSGGIASSTLSIQLLFPPPVSTSGSVADTSGFRFWPMSGRVGSDICESGIVESVGVSVGSASLTLAVRVLFPLPASTSGFVTAI